MLVSRGISAANLLLMLVKLVKILSYITAPRFLHFGRQTSDALLHGTVFLVLANLFAIADKTPPLGQMINRTAKQILMLPVFEIERLRQSDITVVVRILIPVIIRTLPSKEIAIKRITFFYAP